MECSLLSEKQSIKIKDRLIDEIKQTKISTANICTLSVVLNNSNFLQQ